MRKIIGLILSIAMLCQVYIPVSAASTTKKNMDMIISVLKEIEVITIDEDQEFDTEATVSRAKFSEYLGKAIKVYPSFSMQYFNDVPKEHEQAEYINALTDSGIIAMNDAKIFDPERSIKYTEACKMLLCAMGYGDYAAAKGKTMSVYSLVAAETGISITAKDQNALTVAEAMKLLFNAMSEPIMVHNYQQNMSMSIDSSKNLFAEHHDVYFTKGVVEGTCGAYLERYPMPEEGKVIISGTEYETDLDIRDMLGVKVNFAYCWDDENDVGKVIYAEICNEEDILEIESSLLDDYDETTNTFYYLQNKDTKKIKKKKIESSFQIIYNGAPYEGTVTSIISPFLDSTRRGKITLADSDIDGEFDVVIIKSYEVLASGTIDTVEKFIYGGAESGAIDYENFDFVKLFDESGKEKELLDCSNAVLSIAKSNDNKIIEIVLNEETAEITVAKVQFSENEITSREGTIYEVDPAVMAQYGSTLMSYKNIRVSFDMFGYIVKIETGVTDDFLVGYLISGKSYEGETYDTEIEFKIYTRNNKIEKYNFAERIMIDGSTYRLNKNNGALRALNALPKASSYETSRGDTRYRISPQVIRYKLNEEKQITVLDTLVLSENENAKSSLTQRHNNVSMPNTNRLGLDTYWSTSETAIFRIPVLDDQGKLVTGEEPQPKDFSTSMTLSFDKNYNVSTYNFSDDSYYTDIMVIQEDAENYVKEVLIYTGYTQNYDQDENIAYTAIKCYSNGSKATYKLGEGVETQIGSQGLEKGDLFYITLDGSGEYATGIKKIFDAGTLTFNNGGKNDYWYYGDYSPYSNWGYRTGEDDRNNLGKMYVLKKRQDAIFGTYEYDDLKDGKYEEIVRLGNVPVVTVCSQTGEVEKANFNSIRSFEESGGNVSLVLVESKFLSASSVIIYK